MAKQNIYDDEVFFRDFSGKRDDELSFNNAIETPIITSMLPDMAGRTVLDIGCGMGQHAVQYSKMGASSVVGIDISEKMLAWAKERNSLPNISYQRLAFEDLDTLDGKYDVITSSLAFDYAEDFASLMKSVYALLNCPGTLVFSMSHPIATAYDGTYDRYTRTKDKVRLYANLHNYGVEGVRHIRFGPADDCEVYHRRVSTLINDIIGAGFVIEECRESELPEETRLAHLDKFGGVIHQPDFIFFRCARRV